MSLVLVPEMLTLVRLSRGLTQVQLAAEAGVSQGLLSRAETGAVSLDAAVLASVARALGVPQELLTRALADPAGSVCVFHRKRTALPVSKGKQIQAILELERIHLQALVPARDGEVGLERQAPTEDGYVTPEDVARDTRKRLGMSPGPVEDLVQVVEAAGALVAQRDLGTRQLDAIGRWPADGRPLFLLNSTAPADRRRFTLSHEVGHAVMHGTPAEVNEADADRFASEFLMPAPAIREELRDLTSERLIQLKLRWGVSMAALVRRAHDLGTITEYQYRKINIEFSKAGYRTREPVQLAPEIPNKVRDAITARLASGQSMDDLAGAAGLTTRELSARYLEGTE